MKKLLQLGCAAWACLGMVCVGPDGPAPSLPETKLREIGLRILDPEDGRAATFLRWSYPTGEKVTSYEVYQSLRADSLGALMGEVLDPAVDSLLIPLPAITRPFTLYFRVRAVFREATGQKLYSKNLSVDSLIVNPSLEILTPGSLTYHKERQLDLEVRTSSDDGIILRQSFFEKTQGVWSRLLDTCLPMTACGATIFGNSLQKDALILQSVPAGDTLEALLCVLGNESFENANTGRKQSIGCTRFFRTNP